MLNQLVQENVTVGIELWNLVNRDKRVLFLSQLEEDTLVKVFVAMKETEDRAHL